VLKRTAIVVLGLAVLSASGMPLRLPCCSLGKLSATSMQSACCPIPGCSLAEWQGAAPASIERTAIAADPVAASAPPAAVFPAGAVVFAAPPVVFTGFSSPPRGRPPTLALLSVYRI